MLNGVVVQTISRKQHAYAGLRAIVTRADLVKLRDRSSSIFEFAQF